MKKNTIKAILLLISGTCFSGFAQQQKSSLNDFSNKNFEKCTTVQYEKELQKRYPNRATNTEFENWISGEISKQKTNKTISTVTTIPVIFHVITDCGSGVTNLSQELINAQLSQLNIDFSNLAGSTNPAAVDTEVQFALAQVDPTGNILPEIGIERITDFGSGLYNEADIDATIKPVTIWDPTRYLNVWVVNMGVSNLGYAQFPDASGLSGLNPAYGTTNTDGVVVIPEVVGSVANPNPDGAIYANGRTLAHEVGHWLGLRHTWGNGDCAVDDYCADTPTCDGSYYGSGPAPTQCGNTRQIENYLDYSNDMVMNTFTADQKARIQAVLAASPRRIELATSTVANDVNPVVYINSCRETNITEGSDCGYQDITLQVGKSKTSTASETVKFFTSGTAIANHDYEILNSTLNFTAGSTAKQDITIRVFEDLFIESDETIILDLNLITSGNSTISTESNQIIINILDDDLVTKPIAGVTTIQSFENDSEAAIFNLNSIGSIHATNAANGNIMADITNIDDTDFDCVNVHVSRWSSGGAIPYETGWPNYVLWKRFTITPSTIQPSGSVTLKFYFTEAEVASWESAQRQRADLVVIKKINGTYSEYETTTLGSFGTDITLETTFNDGLKGEYYFGTRDAINPALGIKEDQFDMLEVYPNPTGIVQVSLSATENVKISLIDIRGRLVSTEAFNHRSDVFTQTLNFSHVASGVYLLNIESGTKKETKKIVIQ